MTVAGVVNYDSSKNRYNLPKEHASFLGNNAGEDNLAIFSQYIPMMGTVEDDIIDCFKNGGGVPYEKYARFHEVMA